jgi:hypothetical protein
MNESTDPHRGDDSRVAGAETDNLKPDVRNEIVLLPLILIQTDGHHQILRNGCHNVNEK